MYIKLRELIVTQWDVNEDIDVKFNNYATELIVTQWDVNDFFRIGFCFYP